MCIVNEKCQTTALHLSYLSVGWGIPLILSIIPLVIDRYGNTGHWCWVDIRSRTFEEIIFQFFEGFGVALIVIAYNYYCLVLINRKLKSENKTDNHNEIMRKKLMKRMIFYPIVIIVCVLPAAALRILNYTHSNPKWLVVLSADCQCLLGFANSIVYGFTDNLKKKVKSRIETLLDSEKAKLNETHE